MAASWLLLALLFLLGAILFGFSSRPESDAGGRLEPRAASAAPLPVKIMEWNVDTFSYDQTYRSYAVKENIWKYINKEQPHVLILLEHMAWLEKTDLGLEGDQRFGDAWPQPKIDFDGGIDQSFTSSNLRPKIPHPEGYEHVKSFCSAALTAGDPAGTYNREYFGMTEENEPERMKGQGKEMDANAGKRWIGDLFQTQHGGPGNSPLGTNVYPYMLTSVFYRKESGMKPTTKEVMTYKKQNTSTGEDLNGIRRGVVKASFQVPGWEQELTILATHETGGRFEKDYMKDKVGWIGGADIRKKALEQLRRFAGESGHRVIAGDFQTHLEEAFNTTFDKTQCDKLDEDDRLGCVAYSTRGKEIGGMVAQLGTADKPPTGKTRVSIDDFYVSDCLQPAEPQVLNLFTEFVPRDTFLRQVDKDDNPLPDHQPIMVTVTPK